jgi:hypothetical protein
MISNMHLGRPNVKLLEHQQEGLTHETPNTCEYPIAARAWKMLLGRMFLSAIRSNSESVVGGRMLPGHGVSYMRQLT